MTLDINVKFNFKATFINIIYRSCNRNMSQATKKKFFRRRLKLVNFSLIHSQFVTTYWLQADIIYKYLFLGSDILQVAEQSCSLSNDTIKQKLYT
jgi:hypothetical protein